MGISYATAGVGSSRLGVAASVGPERKRERGGLERERERQAEESALREAYVHTWRRISGGCERVRDRAKRDDDDDDDDDNANEPRIGSWQHHHVEEQEERTEMEKSEREGERVEHRPWRIRGKGKSRR